MDDARQPRPDHDADDGGLSVPDGPPPEDPSAGAPGNFTGDERSERAGEHPDPGLEVPDGPPPPDPAEGAQRAP